MAYGLICEKLELGLAAFLNSIKAGSPINIPVIAGQILLPEGEEDGLPLPRINIEAVDAVELYSPGSGAHRVRIRTHVLCQSDDETAAHQRERVGTLVDTIGGNAEFVKWSMSALRQPAQVAYQVTNSPGGSNPPATLNGTYRFILTEGQLLSDPIEVAITTGQYFVLTWLAPSFVQSGTRLYAKLNPASTYAEIAAPATARYVVAAHQAGLITPANAADSREVTELTVDGIKQVGRPQRDYVERHWIDTVEFDFLASPWDPS